MGSSPPNPSEELWFLVRIIIFIFLICGKFATLDCQPSTFCMWNDLFSVWNLTSLHTYQFFLPVNSSFNPRGTARPWGKNWKSGSTRPYLEGHHWPSGFLTFRCGHLSLSILFVSFYRPATLQESSWTVCGFRTEFFEKRHFLGSSFSFKFQLFEDDSPFVD